MTAAVAVGRAVARPPHKSRRAELLRGLTTSILPNFSNRANDLLARSENLRRHMRRQRSH